MSVTATNLTTGIASAVASAATASVSIPANTLILVAVGSVTSTVPTLSGASMTWVAIANDGETLKSERCTVFRGMSASAQSGILTIDFASDSQTRITWSVNKFTTVLTTGSSGADAIVQSAHTNASGSSDALNLASAVTSGNASFGAVCVGNSATGTLGSGYTQLSSTTNGAIQLITQFKAAGTQAVGFGDSSVFAGVVGAEIGAGASSAGGFRRIGF